MHNLMRYIRQNKKQITRVALIVAFLILILQLLNYWAGQKGQSSSDKKSSDIYKESNGTIISDQSAVSGSTVSKKEIKEVSNKIEEFVKYCNEGKTEEAYNLLTDTCKEEFYPNTNSFITYYYEPLFKEKRTYTIENWIEDTYMVRFTGDLLATGKSATDFTYQDYITIETVDGEKKLNINKYIGKEEINKTVNQDNIELTVLNRKKYMDYEEYEIKVINNTEGTILLDQLLAKDTIYLKDNNKTNHMAYNNELSKDEMKIGKGHTKTIKIKFDNPYILGRKINKICFSEVVLNYDPNNYGSYEKTTISVKL